MRYLRRDAIRAGREGVCSCTDLFRPQENDCLIRLDSYKGYKITLLVMLIYSFLYISWAEREGAGCVGRCNIGERMGQIMEKGVGMILVCFGVRKTYNARWSWI